jgi:hypothetical protein
MFYETLLWSTNSPTRSLLLWFLWSYNSFLAMDIRWAISISCSFFVPGFSKKKVDFKWAPSVCLSVTLSCPVHYNWAIYQRN